MAGGNSSFCCKLLLGANKKGEGPAEPVVGKKAGSRTELIRQNFRRFLAVRKEREVEATEVSFFLPSHVQKL